MVAFALLALVTSSISPPVYGPPLDDSEPIHLGIALRNQDQAGLDQLLQDQQDPQSPSYRQWVTPEQFGERFGLPVARYEQIVSLLESHGFKVTRYPSRLFLEALGTSAGVSDLFGVQLRSASADGRTFRSYLGALQMPEALAPDVMRISGLDTRTHLRHRVLAYLGNSQVDALGPDDLRLEYDMTSLISGGKAAAGLTTVVLGTAEGTNNAAPWIAPSDAGIAAYFTLANATAVYKPIELTVTNDYDSEGSNIEYQLDVEMQSVGAANAKNIDFVASGASDVFTTGAAYIVNTLSSAVTVSTSLGLCETEEQQNGTEAATLRATVQQGVAEGQTWFAAAGDDGADDCYPDTGTGFNGGKATIDFPGSMPEIVCMGGTQFASGAGSWNSSADLTAVAAETTWNESPDDGAGGGGQSLLYTKPTWQTGVGPEASDGQRDVPDLALEASTGTPGTAIYDCGAGQDSSCQGETTGAGDLDIIGGTSLAGPLAAGLTALLVGQLGCTTGLGDIHTELYTLGAAGTGFHDITTGNNTYDKITGFTAGTGYDLATGWGSLDLAALAGVWPSCSIATTTGGSSSGGASSGGSSSGGVASSSGSSGGVASSAGSSSSGGVASSSGSGGGVASSSSGAEGNGGSTGSPAGSTAGGANGASGGSGAGGSSGALVGPPPTQPTSSGCSCGSTGGGDASAFGALVWLGFAVLRRRQLR